MIAAQAARPRLGAPVLVALAATLALLLAHALFYQFLTDDAFISFRYARNLAEGHGLVFNPGGERVEGYSNFLWVLVLAGFARVGLAPERVANPLSLLATVALWAVVVRFAIRHRRADASPWAVVIAPAFLALSRSVAVWSTSGLETRAFELLVTAGLMRLAEETDALHSAQAPGRPWGAVLLGLAALTRPDGGLVAVCALVVAGVRIARHPGSGPRSGVIGAWIARAWPALALIVAHQGFRLAYYGAWAPNTYYAKVGGRLHPSQGFEYVAALVLEYAAFLWLPALIAAFASARRSTAGSWIAIATGALLPHLAYAIAIGGDHFEYRPLDLLFPYLGCLLFLGAQSAGEVRWRRLAVRISLALALPGMVVLPWRSHAEFTPVYMPGFPGLQVSTGGVALEEAAVADRFLDPDRSALTRLPLLRPWAQAHRAALLRLTSYYSCIRQEEHRMFFELIDGEARTLRGLMDRGLLPSDVAMAMDCVGAIPYRTNARVLDRLGLTDAHVAHQPFTSELMAHGKTASMDYARERGMDLWFLHPAQLTAPVASSRAMRALVPNAETGTGVFVAPLDSTRWLLAKLPLGLEHARARMPRLRFWDMSDSTDVKAAREAAIRAWSAQRDTSPDDSETLDALGFLFADERRWSEAAGIYRRLAEVTPSDPEPMVNLAACLDRSGDSAGALAALERAADRARQAGDEARFREIAVEIQRRLTSPPGTGH